MKPIRTGSFLLSLGLFGMTVAFVAFPAMAWHKLRETLRLADSRETRRAITRVQVRWGGWLFERIRRIMRLNVERELREAGSHQGPFIVVMNHTSMFDVLAVLWVMRQYKREDLRWIIKREIMYAPFLGRMARWSGNGFVDRNGKAADRDAVTACADLAGRDDSSLVIFVEGTRDMYNLRPPKSGGFRRAIEALPDYAGLLVTVAWFPVTKDGGRTLLEGAALYGKELYIRADVVDAAILHGEGFLERDWVIRHRYIDAWRKRLFFKDLVAHAPHDA